MSFATLKYTKTRENKSLQERASIVHSAKTKPTKSDLRSSKMQKRMALRRRLHILRTLTNSKSVKKSGIIMDAFFYIYKLKLRVEAIKREYQYLINHIQDVKVEKLGTGFFTVRVTCKNSEDILGSILEAFEGMKVNVVQARVTCKHFFGMEAIVEAASADTDETMVNEAVLKALCSN